MHCKIVRFRRTDFEPSADLQSQNRLFIPRRNGNASMTGEDISNEKNRLIRFCGLLLFASQCTFFFGGWKSCDNAGGTLLHSIFIYVNILQFFKQNWRWNIEYLWKLLCWWWFFVWWFKIERNQLPRYPVLTRLRMAKPRRDSEMKEKGVSPRETSIWTHLSVGTKRASHLPSGRRCIALGFFCSCTKWLPVIKLASSSLGDKTTKPWGAARSVGSWPCFRISIADMPFTSQGWIPNPLVKVMSKFQNQTPIFSNTIAANFSLQRRQSSHHEEWS